MTSSISRGVTGPRNPKRNLAYRQEAAALLEDREGLKRTLAESKAAVSSTARTANVDISVSPRKVREPFGTWRAKGIPFDTSERSELEKIRKWSRMYVMGHYLMSSIVNIYTRIPMQGMHLESSDKQLTAFYEQLFMDELDYQNFWIDAGRELWTVGEVTSLGSFDETLGVWEYEDILNPDDIIVSQSPFDRDPRVFLAVPEDLRSIVENRSPAWQYDIIERDFPDIITAVKNTTAGALGDLDANGNPIGALSIAPSLIARTVQKVAPWDLYGTPHMLRVFDLLNQEEMLNAAQAAIADRLYSPMILAKLGGDNLLGQGQPWIPTADEIASFRDMMDAAMQADFRLLAFHYGVDIKNVFGRDQMPKLDNDFERIERKMLQAWGVGAELLSGGQGGSSYASSAINRDFLTQMLQTYQQQIVRHYQKRALVVAEAQGHFEYRKVGSERFPVYEEVKRVDEETGEEYITKRPKLKIPDLKFASLNLKDEAQERTFIQALKKDGAPISDRTLMDRVGVDFDTELAAARSERVAKAIDKAEEAKELWTAITSRGLDQYVQDPAIKALIQDLTSPIPSGAVESDSDDANPEGGSAGEQDGSYAEEEEGAVLPQNRLKSRPEVSDEMRSSRYRSAGKILSGPSVVGMSERLNENSIKALIDDRGWERSIKGKR